MRPLAEDVLRCPTMCSTRKRTKEVCARGVRERVSHSRVASVSRLTPLSIFFGLLPTANQPAIAQLTSSLPELAATPIRPSLREPRNPGILLPPPMQSLPSSEQRLPHPGLLAAGSTLFALSYTPALLVGFIAGIANWGYADSNNPEPIPWVHASNWTLPIPVAGPFLSGSLRIVADRKSKDDSYDFAPFIWSIPWIVIDGVAQVAGMAMIVAAYTHPHKAPVEQPLVSRFIFRPYASSTTIEIIAGGAF